jgi:hypothetical protein
VLSRTSRIIATLVLLISVVCPLIEMFDYWDHTAQTGSDTEYIFVVIALCVGVMFTFARFVLGLTSFLSYAVGVISNFGATQTLFLRGRGSFFTILIPFSPPVLALRI